MHPKVLQSAIEALRLVLRFEHPADAVLTHYFRDERTLGQRDRAFVAEAVFGVLRHKRSLDALTVQATPRRLLLAWLVKFKGASAREIDPVLQSDEAAWLTDVKAFSLEALAPPVRAELPDWVFERLMPVLGPAETLALGRALQDAASLDLRVNVLSTDRGSVLEALRESGIDARATPYSPIGVRVAGRPAVNRHALFLEGRIEVQDEGSQLVGFLVAPRRGELVVDFCAGAGGKSLMLGAMMRSMGRVYAFDVSPARLARLKPRLKRSGLSNLHPHLLASERDTKVKRLAGKIDRVLVDAPCSGLGTLRRNPDLKWRQSPQSVAEMRVKQAALLGAAATLVRPGGRLVYATCSLLPEENEEIVDAFLAGHAEFRQLDCGTLLREQGIEVDTGPRLRLWPHVHATDGFFAAALERAAPG
jgi:16S rRNA (cytosine967-C5)-methyltransferase